MSLLVKTRPAVFNDYNQLLTQLMKERESKAYLHAKTVRKHWQLASVYYLWWKIGKTTFYDNDALWSVRKKEFYQSILELP